MPVTNGAPRNPLHAEGAYRVRLDAGVLDAVDDGGVGKPGMVSASSGIVSL
jgi:hypothetical protein